MNKNTIKADNFLKAMKALDIFNETMRRINMGIGVYFKRDYGKTEFEGDFEISIAGVGLQTPKEVKERLLHINRAVDLCEDCKIYLMDEFVEEQIVKMSD